MERHTAGTLTLTPSKPKPSHNKSKLLEHSNTKLTNPNPIASKSPPIRSATKPVIKSSVTSPSPRNKIRDRKFVVAKKNSKREKSVNSAYESLRVSQDEFKKTGNVIEDEQKENLIENCDSVTEFDEKSALVKRRRDKVLEVARESVPDAGMGRVLHLVKAFENALTITKAKKVDAESEDGSVKVVKWELPGLRPKAPVTEFCSVDVLLTPESLGLDSRSSCCSSGSDHSKPRNSGGGRRSRRNSSESSATFRGKGKRRTVKTTPQQPFKLKTEQRGKSKQEDFLKKMQEMMIEQEKQRIRVAQGLPWTTDEPENLARPPVKEITRPVDLVLHSDMRAVERAEFDHQVQEKLSFIEQFKLEKEKQQKLAEEEELKRLRKELVPKAQPMPYFDRPFVPKRSEKQPTMPKQPKVYNPQQKKTHGGGH
ncbi:hypothetical protein M8C21_000881 [Ambrosia artemisiifolia]|uniref:TPX2 C-terminal domain-containing protein n=1 Tax=Ambrosia artemisiifolia TaxID=4212 RepID=A0AAD5CGC3_AMBAR|nr:hypothetical protein M8C21_000881 [Ambrosia artemisiifolia]